MLGLNQVNIIGNLVHDAKVSYTNSGTPVANFRVAINQADEDTLFIDVTAWGKQAETCKNLCKGEAVFIAGKICFQTWMATDERGEEYDMQKHFITAMRIVFLNRGGNRSFQHQDEEAAAVGV